MGAKDVCFKTKNILNATPCNKVPRHLDEEIQLGIECVMCCLPEKIPENGILCNGTSVVSEVDRRIQSITLKVWVIDETADNLVNEAVDSSLADLGVQNADTVLARFNPDVTDEALIKGWKQMETLFTSQKSRRIGVCDLSPRQMELLFTNAQYPPTLLEVPLHWSSKDSMLSTRRWCKSNDVRLTTRGGDSLEDFNQVDMDALVRGRIKGNFKPSWATRFTVVLRCRSVAATKGYIVHCPGAISD